MEIIMLNRNKQDSTKSVCKTSSVYSFLVIVLIYFQASFAGQTVTGDLAPRGLPDGVINAADMLVLKRIVEGAETATLYDKIIGNVAPLGNPDNELNTADILVLQRAVNGDINLSPTVLPVNPPVIITNDTSTLQNSQSISGVSTPGATVNIYINDIIQQQLIANADGTFTIDVPLINGRNKIYASELFQGGESLPSNNIVINYIAQNTVWNQIDKTIPRHIDSTITIAQGATLTIEAGEKIEFVSGAQLNVEGSLQVNGTQLDPVIFTSSRMGDYWEGIRLGSASVLNVINWAIIEQATTGLELNNNNNNTLISNSTFRNNLKNGLAFIASNGTVTGNTLSNNETGIYLHLASAPVINAGNIITENNYGVYLKGNNEPGNNPKPLINGNQLHTNTKYNIYTENYNQGKYELIDVRGNWWNTVSIDSIAASIYGLTMSDDTTRALVDIRDFLDAANGQVVPGRYLPPLITSDTVLYETSGNYVAVSDVVVKSGVKLTINGNGSVSLVFGPKMGLVVDGELNAKDGYFTGRGTWAGIKINATSIISRITRSYIKDAEIGVDVRPGSQNTTINYSKITNSKKYGIFFNAATGYVNWNTIGNNPTGIYFKDIAPLNVQNNNLWNNEIGLYLDNASPNIGYNTIQSNIKSGVFIEGDSNPYIYRNDFSSNTVLGDSYGINIRGGFLTGVNPQPVINNNNFASNSQSDINTFDFNQGDNIVIDAKRNWWGSIYLRYIERGIYDFTDDNDSSRPILDTREFLDAKNGSPILDNYLPPIITVDTTLTAGQAYVTTSDVIVKQGVTLTIEAGAVLKFSSSMDLIVNGSLQVSGTEANPVIFTQSDDRWSGIKINASATNININWAKIEWVKQGESAVEVLSTSNDTVISNSYFNFVFGTGIYFNGASGIANNNAIYNAKNSIHIKNASPQISSNIIGNSTNSGILIEGLSNPAINLGNIITNNKYGIYLKGTNSVGNNPQPVINNNQIHSNTVNNIYTADFYQGEAVNIDAKNNWWNTTSINEIATGIYDYTDDVVAHPIVDFSGFLDAASGTPVLVNTLPTIISSNKILTAGTIYFSMSKVHVKPGVTLTIEPGVILKFGTSMGLVVDGNLQLRGTQANPITLTSETGELWPGIKINAVSANSVVEWANIEYASTGIEVEAGSDNASILNSNFRNNLNGIVFSGTNGSITNNTITNNENGIVVVSASPQISGNIVTNNTATGVVVKGLSLPLINLNNVITNNSTGLLLKGGNLEGENPQPTINGNEIHSNQVNINTQNYYQGENVVINATGNWWNTTDISEIVDAIVDYTDSGVTSYALVDIRSFLDVNRQVVTGNYLPPLISSNTTLAAGVPYLATSDVIVQPGIQLIIEPGAILQFESSMSLVVKGELQINAAANKVVFQSQHAPVKRWGTAIVIDSTATNTLISGVIIEHAVYGIESYQGHVNTQIVNSVFQNNTTGIQARGGEIEITGNVIKNNRNGMYVAYSNGRIYGNSILNNEVGIHLVAASPQIFQNAIKDNADGILLFYKSKPYTVSNVITNNNIGINIKGLGTHLSTNPKPRINNNEIHTNTLYNISTEKFYRGSEFVIDATSNNWGTTINSEISAKILDYSDGNNPERPIIGFLGTEAANDALLTGNIVPANILKDTILKAGEIYTAQSNIIVKPGVTLTIEAGATVQFYASQGLTVEGSLQINGTEINKVKLTTLSTSKWSGIRIKSTAFNVSINHALIEKATYGVYFENATGTVSDSVFSSNRYAIYIYGNSTPTINSNTITNNDYGIYLKGILNSNPQTNIINNTITNNALGNLFLDTITGEIPLAISGNNWGTENLDEIRATIKVAGGSNQNTLLPFVLKQPKILPRLNPSDTPGLPETFGYTQGEFKVDESGAATYNIPLQLPPATAGMAPQLSLAYNSLGGNGLLGKGWSLNGLSAITRCGKNINIDGESRGVNLTYEDRFCVDGQRLIRIIEASGYGLNYTYYRTEMDSYTTYTAFGVQGNGPAYFEAKTKSGLIMTYGHVQTGYDSRIEATNSNTVLSWQIGKVEDTVGNYYLFNYLQDANGSTRPDKIDYAFLNGGGSNGNSVQFKYGNRLDITKGYLAGSELTKDKKLERIEIFANGSLLKDYWLGYEYFGSRNQPILNRIQECASTKCKPAIKLTNQGVVSSGGWLTDNWNLRGNINPQYPDSKIHPLAQISKLNYFAPVTSENSDAGGVRFIDINGDGKIDYLWAKDLNQVDFESYAMINTGGRWVNDPNYAPKYPFINNKQKDINNAGSQLIDINGDGLVDQFYARLKRYNTSTGFTHKYETGVAINTGTGWKEHAGYSDIPKVPIQGTPTFLEKVLLAFDAIPGADLGTRLIDIDGDGLVDILVYDFNPNIPYNSTEGQVRGAFLNTGSGWKASDAYTPQFPISNLSGDIGSRFVDLNGDGLVDQIYSRYTDDVTGLWRLETGVAINTGSGWDIDNEYATSFSSSNISIIYENGISYRSGSAIDYGKDQGVRIVDINGDGLVDIVKYKQYEKASIVYLNTGTSFVADNSYAVIYPVIDYLGKDVGSRFIDVNGDGLIDQVISRGSSEIEAWLTTYGVAINTGTGWNTNNLFSVAMESNVLVDLYPGQDNDRGIRFIDVNSDGLVDILKNRNGDKSAWINTGTSWVEDSVNYAPEYPIVDAQGNDYGSRFLDVDGDGFVDQLYSWFNVDNSSEGIALNKGKPQLLTKIEIPNGVTHAINYKNTTDPFVYKADKFQYADGVYSLLSRPSAENQVDPAWDKLVRDLTPNINVVSQYSVSNGLGGNSSTSYLYRGYKVHLKRGSLGFRVVEDQDLKTSIMTKTTYRQDYPYTGMMLDREEGLNLVDTLNTVLDCGASSTKPYKGATSVASKSSPKSTAGCVLTKTSPPLSAEIIFNSLKNKVFHSGEVTDGTRQLIIKAPHVTQSYEEQNNLTTGKFVSSITTESAYDKEGNASWMKVSTLDNSGAYVKETTNIYDPIKIQLGRLTSTTVKSTNPKMQTATRVSAFEYHPVTGLLTKEIIEPQNHPDSSGNSALTKITTYGYDNFGNKETVTVSSAITNKLDVAYFAPRSSKTIYDSQGLFIDYIENAYGHKEFRTYEPAYGNLLEQTGPNLITTRWKYDEFGRKEYEYRQDGTYTQITADWCLTLCTVPALSPNDVPQTATYVVTTQEQKSGVTYSSPVSVYYDQLGREIRRTTIGFAGETIYKDINYDDWGHLTAESSLYSTIAKAYPTTNTYDSYGRLKEQNSPDSGKSRFVYNGLTTTTYVDVTNASGTSPDHEQKRVETKNALGYLLSVTDSKNQNISYEYDAFGNRERTIVPSTEHAALARDLVTHISYDVLGRKYAMSDPDMGNWLYTYNAAGELVSQTDAKTQVTKLKYDLLGRLIERSEFNTAGDLTNRSNWVYENSLNPVCAAPAGKGSGKCIGKLIVESDTNAFSKSYAYNELGLLSEVTRTISGEQFTQNTTFDDYSRVESITYPQTGGPDYRFVVKQAYNQNGYLQKVTSANGAINYWQADTMDARGMVATATLGNGVEIWNNYNGAGRIIDQDYKKGLNNLYHATYGYDSVGNLVTRNSTRRTTSGSQLSMNEGFGYDELNRLTSVGDGINTTANYVYDGLGNIKTKQGVSGTYQYHPDRPHAVETANGNTYLYDENGNMISGAGRTIGWNVNNKPTSISKAGTEITFAYAPDRSRYFKFSTDGTKWTKTNYAGGLFEREINSDGKIKYKHFIQAAGQTIAIHTRDENLVQNTEYLLRDYQGSVVAITSNSGAVKAQLDFYAFGSRREVSGSLISNVAALFNRGYTGHEHLDDVGLIHMNGRVYDPMLGRFISADPNVQAPKNLQSLNRYSYVMNNPMTLVDPSGFFFSKLMKKVSRFVSKYGRTIVSIAIAAVVPGGYAFVGGFLSGYVLSGGDIRSAFFGAFAAIAFGALHSNVFSVERLLGHGILGGALSSVQGGRFKDGFLGSAVTFGLGSAGIFKSLNLSALNQTTWSRVKNAFVAGIIGGTASVIGGGKFQNGAVSGAFSRLFNDMATPSRRVGMLKDAGLGGLDERGAELFYRWLNGTGEDLFTNGGVWGEYMSSNYTLKNQVDIALYGENATRQQSGFVNFSIHAEIENGYTTGYQMLHGTNSYLGDLTIQGFADVISPTQTSYNVLVTWNDRIDPNNRYFGDVVRAGILNTFFSPADYNVHISWQHSRTVTTESK